MDHDNDDLIGEPRSPPVSADNGGALPLSAEAGVEDEPSTEAEAKRFALAKAWKRANDLPGRVSGEPLLFVNPPLNILLDLYISHREARLINVSSVCIGSGAPATTALRYIARLSEMGLVRKTEDARDHRVHYVDLTPDGLTRMTEMLDLFGDGDKRLGIDRMGFVQ